MLSGDSNSLIENLVNCKIGQKNYPDCSPERRTVIENLRIKVRKSFFLMFNQSARKRRGKSGS